MSWLQIIIYVLIALYILTVASVVFNVILENRNPVRTLAWIIVLVTVPLVGFLFYLYFGVNYRKNKMFSMKGLGDMKWLQYMSEDQKQLIRAIDLAHLKGKQLYLTINTLLKNRELETELYEYLAPLYEAGLDAVIVQDPGVMDFVKTYFPGRAATEKTPLLLVTFPTAIVLSGKESNCTVACAIGLLSSPSTTVPLTVTRLLPWAQERVVPVHTSNNKSINFFIFLFS